MDSRKVVFISGLHRSGTSMLHRILSSSDDVSGFENTGVPEDEGQHVQSVFKPAIAYGGPGKFAFHKEARLDEKSPLVTEANREKLLKEWTQYWDSEKSIWVEKSPPNLIRMRFFQEMFPNAYFITLMRHPLVVSLATQKWSKTSISRLLEHWIRAHNIYREDKKKINHEISLYYEDLAVNPKENFARLENFLGTKINYQGDFKNMNGKYLKKWEDVKSWQILRKMEKSGIERRYEDAVNEFGYSLVDLTKVPSSANVTG